jgi:hypothetical protein
MINTNDGNNDLDPRIRAALKDFIEVDWELLGHERSGATPGFERIKVIALAKVPAEQNRNLEERARQANREGLEFGAITVKRSLPQDQVNQIVKELWFEAVTRVNGHLAEFEHVSGRKWRMGNIVLGIPDGGHRTRSGKGGYMDDLDDTLGQLLESGLSGVEKISLIELCSSDSHFTFMIFSYLAFRPAIKPRRIKRTEIATAIKSVRRFHCAFEQWLLEFCETFVIPVAVSTHHDKFIECQLEAFQ